MCAHFFPFVQIQAYAVVAAEELFFSVELHRLPMKSSIRVDFNLCAVGILANAWVSPRRDPECGNDAGQRASFSRDDGCNPQGLP